MILSDRDIRKQLEGGRLVIEPFDPSLVQPSSVDLRVDNVFRVFHNARHPYIDVRNPMEDLTEEVRVEQDEPFILHPGEFVLGSTLERVALPEDLVGRIEGKSSLGRLGLLIHSSLPGSEPVAVLQGDHLGQMPIADVVRKQIPGSVVAFDPETFEVGYHEITGWYEGPPDRIFEVQLRSGRHVRVTGGHSLFTLGRDGNIAKVRTLELAPGDRVAIPARIPDPPDTRTEIDILEFAPESEWGRLVVVGPAVEAAFARDPQEVQSILLELGRKHHGFYRANRRLPLVAALQISGFLASMGAEDQISVRGSSRSLPRMLEIDGELAWLLGLYVAEGSRREKQATIANTDESILDRAEQILASLSVPIYRRGIHLTACSRLFSSLLGWLGAGERARMKRVPPVVLGWPKQLLEAFLEGFIDGDGSQERTRTSLWSSSGQLVGDFLMLAPRLGLRASACFRERDGARPAYQVSLPRREHKLLLAVPLPDRLLAEIRTESGKTQKEVASALGYQGGSRMNNLERRFQSAVGLPTLRRLRTYYRSMTVPPPSLPRLDRLVDGAIAWDSIVEVRDTGSTEPVYDLEVRPNGKHIENFLAGSGGIFVSNTAGFIDAGWNGHLTLELSNVANLPITIYPGMKIGQLCLFQMSSPAEHPYGEKGKYQDQRGPTPSRFYEDFRRAPDPGAEEPPMA